MKFYGDYEVSRNLKAKNLEVSGTSTVQDLSVTGKFSIATAQTVDMKANRVQNVATPTASTDAATKSYVDSNNRHIHVGIDVPQANIGANEDLYFRGTLGGLNRLTGITGANVTDIASDGTTIIVTTDSGQGKYYVSKDHGESWTIQTITASTTNKFRYVANITTDKFIIARSQAGDSAAPCHYSVNGGTSWSNCTVPTGAAHNVTDIIVDKATADNKLVMLRDAGVPWYSVDAGATFAAATGAPSANYQFGAMFGDVVMIVDSNNICYRSTDGGRTYSQQSTLPSSSVTWGSMVAVDHLTFIAGGRGNGSGTVAVTTNTGTSWVEQVVSTDPLEIIDLSVNRVTGTIVAVGDNRSIRTTKISDYKTWSVGIIDDNAHVSRDIDTHGSSFIGVSFGANPVVARSTNSQATIWTVNNEPGFSELYTRSNGKWIVLSVLQREQADSLYLSVKGGVVNGNLAMNSHRISGVSDPQQPNDVVNRQYLESQLQTQNGIFINKTIGTQAQPIDTVGKDVETFKHQVIAKKDNKRYFSEVNYVANGVDAPVSAEYAVMNIGGLDITINATKLSNGDTQVTASASESGVELRIKREIIDI